MNKAAIVPLRCRARPPGAGRYRAQNVALVAASTAAQAPAYVRRW